MAIQLENGAIIEDVGDLLIQLGIHPDLYGFKYTEKGVEILNNLDNQEFPIDVCILYDKVGEFYSTSRVRVERSIRHAVETVYNNNNADNPVLKTIVGDSISISKGKLTAGKFLYTIARYCRKNKLEAYPNEVLKVDPKVKAQALTARKQAQIRQKFLDKLLEREFPEYRGEMNACIK